MNAMRAAILAAILACAGPARAVAPDGMAGPAGALLPAGYLHTSGAQITDAGGHDVRLACAGYFQVTVSVAADVQGMKADGFNCIRMSWYNATRLRDIAFADRAAAAAARMGLKIILDHHGDETPGPANHYLPYPCNGLPFDLGPGTDGTDGCGDAGTVTRARYVADWVKVARHYAGNATIAGYDLTNEPHLFPAFWTPPGGATWGGGGVTDLRAIYAEAGNAIQAVDPGPLIIAEGIENWTSTLFNGAANPITGYADLTTAQALPVMLNVPDKLVWSVHDYPATISGTSPDSGAAKIAGMNAAFGYLVSGHIAPVWIGEMGASLDGVGPDSAGAANLADERAWAVTLTDYLNGKDGAAGGPVFTGCEQPVGTDWWAWGHFDGGAPDGTVGANGRPRPQQLVRYRTLRFVRPGGC